MAIKPQSILSMEDAMSNLLFGSAPQAKEENNPKSDLIEIPYEKLVYYKDQHYRMYTPEEAQRTIDSIKQVGVLEPPIVRPLENGVYEVLAGRNRTECAKLAGIPAMPCKVIEANDETAVLIVNATNLCRRESVSVMEKAWGYRQMLESLEKMGKQKTISAVAQTMEESTKSIYRCIRLTYLIDEFVKMLENNELGEITGYELSFLSDIEQLTVYEYFKAESKKLTLALVKELRELKQDHQTLSFSLIDSMFDKKRSAKPCMNMCSVKIDFKNLQPLLCSKGLLSDNELTTLKPKQLQQRLTQIIINLLEQH